jgi:hypothetical protein
MKMDRKYVYRRRAVFAILVFLLTSIFTYSTRDVCYVGLNEPGTRLGYGSCMSMIDNVIRQGR